MKIEIVTIQKIAKLWHESLQREVHDEASQQQRREEQLL
jgi:hypothetical protein